MHAPIARQLERPRRAEIEARRNSKEPQKVRHVARETASDGKRVDKQQDDAGLLRREWFVPEWIQPSAVATSNSDSPTIRCLPARQVRTIISDDRKSAHFTRLGRRQAVAARQPE